MISLKFLFGSFSSDCKPASHGFLVYLLTFLCRAVTGIAVTRDGASLFSTSLGLQKYQRNRKKFKNLDEGFGRHAVAHYVSMAVMLSKLLLSENEVESIFLFFLKLFLNIVFFRLNT